MPEAASDRTPAPALPSDQNASGRSLAGEELALLAEVIRSGTLTSTRGRFVRQLEERFAALLGVRSAVACASGTAAIHAAVAALDLEPGEEIVTSAVTDMGAIAPILYQGAIPVFADVDVRTCTLTARTIEARLSERTRAVIVTHLFGCPCEMKPIMDLAAARDIRIIEDCAQAYLAEVDGRRVGTLGTIGCFSLQQGKHMTAGEGGLVVTDDEALARRIRLFVNKGWGYGDPDPDHTLLALNYRMSELSGAVAVAQLGKLGAAVRHRVARATALTAALRDLPGIAPPWVPPGSVHTFWRYCVRVDRRVIPGGPRAMAGRLAPEGIVAAPRYIGKPAFQCAVIRDQRTFGRSRYPFTLARPEALDYAPARFPGTFEALDQALVLPWNERYSEADVTRIATAMREAATRLAEPASAGLAADGTDR